VEQGQRLHVKKEAFTILQELGNRTGMAERNVATMPSGVKAGAEGADAKNPANSYSLGLGLEEPASPIRIDDEDELVEVSATSVPHVGPLEGKLIKGSDGRVYVLELTRLTPRDANYVSKAKGGTGLLAAAVDTEGFDAELASAYLLRPELLAAFKLSERESAQQEVVQKYVAEEQVRKEKLIAALAAEAKDKPDAAAAPAAEKEKEKERSPLELEYEAEQAKASTALLEEVAAVDKVIMDKQLRINPNVFFSQFAADVAPEVVEQDEATARELATFLHDVVCPGLTAAVRKGDRAAPMDCAAAAK
jgi:protein TIF31